MGTGSNTFQGALGGAMTGASMGSLLGPWGTAAGGLLGGVIGGFAGHNGPQGAGGYEDQLKQLSEYYKNRQSPQASMAENSQFRANQAGLVSQLEAMSQGRGPSAATMMMREAMDRAAGSQASAAAGAGGRGVNAGAAFRNSANNTAAIQSQGARDTGLMRTQEQLGAINQLGGVLAQGRAADEGTSQFNAAQQNQMAMGTMGANDTASLQALGMGMGVAGPSMGQQLLSGGAMMVGPAMQYAQSQRQMQMQKGFQQQQLDMQKAYMQYLQGGQQPNYGADPNYQYASNMAASMGQPANQPASFGGLPSQSAPSPYMQQFMPRMPGY